MDSRATEIRPIPPRLTTLVLMASVGPLAMNIFVPSMPAMARHFQADYSVVQLLVSLYLVALAVAQLLIGPASDRFGRRPVLLACFALFCVATLGALYAPTIQVLLAWRVAQAGSAAGIVLSRAIVRDTVDTDDAASKIGYITMGMSVTPMIAPFIGGYLDEHYGWQASFVVSFIFGLIVLAVCWIDLEETNLSPSYSMRSQFHAYPELFRSRRFWGYTAVSLFTSGIFFAFLGGGPYVSTEMLHMTPSQYGLYFGLVSLGYLIGNYISGRYSKAMGINRMMALGAVISVAAMLLMAAIFHAGFYHPLSLFAPAALVGIGNGVTLPSANAGIVSVRPHLAGSASGLGGALTIGGCALLAVAGSAFLDAGTGPFPLIFVCLGSALAALGATLFVIRRAAEVGELE